MGEEKCDGRVGYVGEEKGIGGRDLMGNEERRVG